MTLKLGGDVRKFPVPFAIPSAMVLAIGAAVIASLLFLSAERTDSISFERQEKLVSLILDQSAVKMAKEQEGMTFKDQTASWLVIPPTDEDNVGQMDRNFGTFFYKYYGHDETYGLKGDNNPFYAMRNGSRASPAAYETVRQAAEPVVAELRAKTRAIPRGVRPRNGSPGAHDIVVVNGHPAILSVKPIMSNSGKNYQPPGEETVHISIMYLDGRFIATLHNDYLLKDARFSWTDDKIGDQASRPFLSRRTGKVVGYFIWRPYAPGTIMLGDMVIPLAVMLLLVGSIVWLLLRRIQRSTAKLQASEAQAKHLAFHDVLTGLPNRAFFGDRMNRALAVVRRHPERQIALLCLDVDRFKKVNDTLGHPAGDELIRELGKRLSNVVRDTDTVARLGGDEFAIIQTDVRSQHEIELLCQRILAVVSEPFDVVGSQVFVGMSIGVARSGMDGLDRTELNRKADIALYHAKHEGRGRWEIFCDNLDATIQIRRTMERDLRIALAKGDELEVYYQPLYDAASKTVTGMEALVRWHHPKRGMMCPAAFIPIAEETGLIEPLGEWVLSEACAAGALWPIETVSVNISVVQLRNPLFVKSVGDILHTTGLASSRLELEITETSFLESVGQCAANLKALRSLGIRIALDDFGTGYSSFNHLRAYQVDRLKIDRSFTAAIESSSIGSPIVQAIVDLARTSGLKVTAEGVETMEQSIFLSAAGCDELQGFLMSRAIPLSEVDAMLGVPASARAETDRTDVAA